MADFKVTLLFDSKSILEFYVLYYIENSSNNYNAYYYSSKIFIAHVGFRVNNNVIKMRTLLLRVAEFTK